MKSGVSQTPLKGGGDMLDLFMKLKLVFDTIVSFFQVLKLIIEYLKKYFDNKNRRSSDKS